MPQSSRVKGPRVLYWASQCEKPRTSLMLKALVETYLKSPPDLSLVERGLGNTKSMVKEESY